MEKAFTGLTSPMVEDNGDGTHVPLVKVINAGGGSSGPDRELVVSTYRCKTAFTGASVGDTITATQVIDVSGATPSTVSTVWRNQTTAADLASVPSAANLELTGSTALTSAQLTAAGLALESTQSAILIRATDINLGIGARNDTAATSDTGTFSLIAFVKRALQNWTILLARIPEAINGRVPVHSKDANGEDAVVYVTNTNPVVSINARHVVCLTDTVFSTFTRSSSTGSITGITLPAGTLLVGPVTALTLTSGAVACYA
jgi:hypothetical protein